MPLLFPDDVMQHLTLVQYRLMTETYCPGLDYLFIYLHVTVLFGSWGLPESTQLRFGC